jgi:hypothetical protein
LGGVVKAALWVVWALLLAGYLVVATMTWRRAAWVFADKSRFEPQAPFTRFEIVWGLVAGAVFASVWPITLAVYAIHTRGIGFLGSRFLLPPEHVRLEQATRRAEEHECRIAELERRTEIGGHDALASVLEGTMRD